MGVQMVQIGIAALLLFAVVFFASRKFRRWILGPPPGFTITLARLTTQEGETLQVSTTAPVGATGKQIGKIVDIMAEAVDYRRDTWNDFVVKQELQSKHTIWKRVKSKLDSGAKLSKEENNWWTRFGTDFNEDGPVVARGKKVVGGNNAVKLDEESDSHSSD